MGMTTLIRAFFILCVIAFLGVLTCGMLCARDWPALDKLYR